MQAYQLDTLHPFVDRELILASKVMEMLYQSRCELPDAWSGFGSCSVDDSLCEVRIELVLFAVLYCCAIGSHFVINNSKVASSCLAYIKKDRVRLLGVLVLSLASDKSMFCHATCEP